MKELFLFYFYNLNNELGTPSYQVNFILYEANSIKKHLCGRFYSSMLLRMILFCILIHLSIIL